jgi:lipoate-protein ligase A
MKTWFLLIDPKPLRGSLNMAVDEFLFQALGSEPRTVLRFYQWERATASLGFSQKIQSVVDVAFCRKNGIDIVRRMTGGKLVLHHRELTYSVVSNDEDGFTATLSGSYRLISQALVKGLARMGVAATLAGKAPLSYARGTMPCFSHPAQDEIAVGGRKIIGSAQRRMGKRFLQHGSIPLAGEENLLKTVSLYPVEDDILMTSLSREIGTEVDCGWASERLAAGFKDFFGIAFAPLIKSEEDDRQILEIERRKYANPRWTMEGSTSEPGDALPT